MFPIPPATGRMVSGQGDPNDGASRIVTVGVSGGSIPPLGTKPTKAAHMEQCRGNAEMSGGSNPPVGATLSWNRGISAYHSPAS